MKRVKMTGENATFVPASSAPQREIRPGVHGRVLGTTGQIMLVEFYIERGSEVPTHSHPHEQVGYLVSGRMEFTIADDTRIVESGGSYAIPGNVPHRALALTNVIVIEAFSPPREDFRSPAPV